jgi:hypothetical protein
MAEQFCLNCNHSGWSHDTMTGDCMQCSCRAFKQPVSDQGAEGSGKS